MKKIAVAVLVLALLFMPALAMPVKAAPRPDSPAWYMVPSSQPSAQVVTYDELTALCLAAGLRSNPYPAPAVPTVVGPDANGDMYIHDTEYRVFTQAIGDVVYQGVSYDPFDMTYNVFTADGQMVYQAVWYLGDLGRMNHGFFGPINVAFFGAYTAGYYYTANMALQGFGHFNHQTVVMTGDTRVPGVLSGYCLVLGNRVK